MIPYSAADLTALAIESQSLESTYTALYSTINKVNNLSLVKCYNDIKKMVDSKKIKIFK